MTSRSRDSRDNAVPDSSSRVRVTERMQLNPEPLAVVDESRRRFWEELADEVQINVPGGFRKRWSKAETVRVISARPDETYEEVAEELDRTPGGVRYRRMAMVHLLREEHGAVERVRAYEADPKANHKQHDYWDVHLTMRELGLYDLPVWQQLELAKELRQPSKGWRGDGTGAALASGDLLKQIRVKVQRLMQDARTRHVR